MITDPTHNPTQMLRMTMQTSWNFFTANMLVWGEKLTLSCQTVVFGDSSIVVLHSYHDGAVGHHSLLRGHVHCPIRIRWRGQRRTGLTRSPWKRSGHSSKSLGSMVGHMVSFKSSWSSMLQPPSTWTRAGLFWIFTDGTELGKAS